MTSYRAHDKIGPRSPERRLATKDLRAFLTEFRARPRAIGAIAPSSRKLAETMMAPIDFTRATAIVELGPGTGVMTQAIAARLGPQGRYVGVEISARFHRMLHLRFPQLTFVNDSAEHLGRILETSGLHAADAVVCGLPWASLPTDLQTRILAAVAASLKPGGLFITFAYLQGLLLPAARLFRHRLGATFASVERTPIVWSNLPPAFAYVCRKEGEL
jgi:phospholipid N-methyltransferase